MRVASFMFTFERDFGNNIVEHDLNKLLSKVDIIEKKIVSGRDGYSIIIFYNKRGGGE